MTREEFKVLVKTMKAVYTHPSFIPDRDAFNVWYEMLKDLDYGITSYAVKKYMQSEEKEPTVAGIRKHAAQLLEKGRGLNEMAAWQMVLKAMRNSIYHSEEEFAKLPPTVQKAVVSPGQLREWAMAEDIDGTWMNVTQSNFMRTYRVEVSREAEARKLSPDLLRLAGITLEKIATENVEPKAISVSEERIQAEKESVPMSERLKKKYMALMGQAV